MQQPQCKLCSEPITSADRSEYTRSYSNRTPEAEKERVHSRCVAAQVRNVLRLMAQVPENKRDEIYFDI